MAEEAKVRHHFLPAFYLKGFADAGNDGLVWVYSKQSDKLFCDKPENIGLEKHYHSFQRPDGTKDTNTIEDYFCHVWEGPTAKIIESIKGGSLPTGEDRAFFASFLGLSLTRSPNHRSNVNRAITHMARTVTQFSTADPEKFAQTLRNYERDMREKLTDDPEELRKFISEGEYELTANPALYLKMFVAHGVRFGQVIEKMTWAFIRATDRIKFLTCDNPFFFHDATADSRSIYGGVGLLSKHVEVSFPVSKDLALVAAWDERLKPGYFQATHELAKTVNRRTVLAAHRFVYAPEKSEAIARLVQKHANDRPTLVVS